MRPTRPPAALPRGRVRRSWRCWRCSPPTRWRRPRASCWPSATSRWSAAPTARASPPARRSTPATRCITGAQSNAQLRFSDNALVALKPDSEFRIEAYAFTGNTDGSERAVFRLVRGGFRTVTGQVGQVNRDTYQVLTTQATIGIRGTHYQLQICGARPMPRQPKRAIRPQPGCTAACSKAWSRVTAGGITEEYGEREYFVVLDDEAPRRLLAPPTFLADQLSGRPVGERAPPIRPRSSLPFRRIRDRSVAAAAAVRVLGDRGPEQRVRSSRPTEHHGRRRLGPLHDRVGLDRRRRARSAAMPPGG